jgi:hypothetical protein
LNSAAPEIEKRALIRERRESPKAEGTMADAIKGVLVGVLFGGLSGLGVCVFLIEGTLFFPGDTIAIGAVSCGLLGYFLGDTFFEWLRDNWWNL